MSRLLAVVATALLVLAACNGGGEEADPAASPGTPTGTAAAPAGTASPLVQDGLFTGQGVVLPVPEGWQVNQANLPFGLVLALPTGQGSTREGLVAAADILTNPQVELESDTLEGLVQELRDQEGQEPTIDRALQNFKGAEAAHQLVWENLTPRRAGTVSPGPPINRLTIVARGPDGQFALFNYAAPQDAFQESIADRLRNQGGLDPESEPSRRSPGPLRTTPAG